MSANWVKSLSNKIKQVVLSVLSYSIVHWVWILTQKSPAVGCFQSLFEVNEGSDRAVSQLNMVV